MKQGNEAGFIGCGLVVAETLHRLLFLFVIFVSFVVNDLN
jgi:hypothetical protein